MERKKQLIAVNWLIETKNKILLQRRGSTPYKDYWELGGGIVEYGEIIEHALIREAKEETGLRIKPVSIIGVYSDKNRDPRGHVVAILFSARITGGKLSTNLEAKEFKWVESNKINSIKLAFDHNKMVKDYMKWKKTGKRIDKQGP